MMKIDDKLSENNKKNQRKKWKCINLKRKLFEISAETYEKMTQK